MHLYQQILTIVVSILYGACSYFLFLLNKKFLFSPNNFKNLLTNILFIIDLVLIYFIIIRYINNGILSYYSYLLIIFGILVSDYIMKKRKTYKK